ncbi:MAG: Rho-binding antiterminator [Gammaproteobacteria bacterium]|nr:Rho-binding antiterminator [Gammaproteobacteria bacterium]
MISCHLHDFIEIACLYQYRVCISFIDGTHLEGTAHTTYTDKDKKEILVLRLDQKDQNIDLNQIKQMQAITPNPHFNTVKF